jgi:inorganic triphosphatase YgiF
MDPDREVELKLELTPDAAGRVLEHPVVRTLAVGPAEVHELHSVYFDTRDLALANDGIALRLRRPGDSQGRQLQTVKFGDGGSAGLFSRGEVEDEVAGERPDPAAIRNDAVRARLLEVLAGQPLEPVFETEMRRTHLQLRDDAAEWSLDLDEGEVRAGFAREPIHELELELHSGRASRLYEVALALSESVPLWPGTRSKAERGHALRTGERPAPTRARVPELSRDATLAEAMHRIALSCLTQISANTVPAWEGIDPEGVHQMRVGVRRMRSLFSALRPVLPAREMRPLRTQLRWLAGQLGEVRDLDVFIDDLLLPLFRLRGNDAALKRLLDEALALREERRLALRKALRSRRHTRLVLQLGGWIARSAERAATLDELPTPLSERANAFSDVVLERLHRKTEKLASKVLSGPPAARHDLRIALKKQRYACEFFRTLYGAKDAKRYLRRLSRLQDLLGALNDVDTAGRVLQELLERTEPEQAEGLARAAGFVEGFAAREDGLALRKLASRWERFARARPFWADR